MIALVVALGYLVAAIIGWRGTPRRRRLTRFAVCVGVFAGLVGSQRALLWGVFLPSLGAEASRVHQELADDVSVVHVGNSVPSILLTDTAGNIFDLDKLRGKIVLINFFATWCGPCIQELPVIQELWNKNRENDRFALLVIGREETNDSVKDFKSTHGFTFPMAADPNRSAYSAFADEVIPRTFLVSPEGRITYSSTGFSKAEMSKLEDELTSLFSRTSR
ncbi:MAG: TlpA disulfide reductase family protein [Planctomycetaceae bacterium]